MTGHCRASGVSGVEPNPSMIMFKKSGRMVISSGLMGVNNEAMEGISVGALHEGKGMVEVMESEVGEDSKVRGGDSSAEFIHDPCFI